MRLFSIAMDQPRVFFSGVLVGAALLATGYLLALMGGGASATHDGTSNIHACINAYTSQVRIIPPGRTPNCSAVEKLIEWPGVAIHADIAALETRVDAVERNDASQQVLLETMTVDLSALTAQVPDCLSEDNGTALFDGCNVQIVNGLSLTETVNGLGNLIIGYNEDDLIDMEARGGSHNLVIGTDHTYTSYGGLVAGTSNEITGPYASASGGRNNTASGNQASVSGGTANIASGAGTSVSGGIGNVASGLNSSISGGFGNVASGAHASVSGGINNQANGDNASASGGFSNTASGLSSSVHGGRSNVASGEHATVSGGNSRSATGENDWVAGGLLQEF